jgi:NAD(P)-dependent dehydrogenase (short-subunit alcohol dehydrogenase family)
MTTIALVTGANRGLGLDIARHLGRAGVTTILGARDRDAGAQAAAALCREGLDVRAVRLDVTSDATVGHAVDVVARAHGRLDILVNNAGILPEAADEPAEVPDVGRFEQTFATNVFGVARVTKAFLPLLHRSPAGRIVNVSSRMGSLQDQLDTSSPYFGLVMPAYQASKAALNALTVALSKQLAGTSITVSSVCPGWAQTDLAPGNRELAPLSAADAARTVADVALQRSPALAGAFVDRDGSVPW